MAFIDQLTKTFDGAVHKAAAAADNIAADVMHAGCRASLAVQGYRSAWPEEGFFTPFQQQETYGKALGGQALIVREEGQYPRIEYL